MKNQYVGDVNDYVKYAFLRRVIQAGSNIAVCWMLTSDDGRTDGRRRGYLDKPEHYRRHDPELFDALAGELSQARKINRVEESGILPNARFFSDPLNDRQALRNAYFERLYATLTPHSLVFFDPDNGLDVATVPSGRRNSSKYLYREEVAAVFAAGHSAIVYQHFPRVARERFLSAVFTSLESPSGDMQFACIHTSHVAYLLLLQDPHAAVLETARKFAREWEPIVKYSDATGERPPT